jgi:hypothetical protein
MVPKIISSVKVDDSGLEKLHYLRDFLESEFAKRKNTTQTPDY